MSLTHTIVVPGRNRVDALLTALIASGHEFHVSPSKYESEVWHVSVPRAGVDLVAGLFGPAVDIEL